jgi:cyanophycinase
METPKGKLIPIGGFEAKKDENREDTEQKIDFRNGILKEIIREIRNPKPVVEVFTGAAKDQVETGKRYQEAFGNLGNEVRVISAKDRDEVDDIKNMERLQKADCIFLTEGDQSRLKSILSGSQFLETLRHRYYHDDFIIAGNSAGAMIMSEYMIDAGFSNDSIIKGNVTLSEGFEFLPGTIIDTHFLKRCRMARLTESLLQKRDCTGIGICEDTAAVITAGNEVKALGTGTVTIIEIYDIGKTNYDQANEKDAVYVENVIFHFLSSGARYFLKEKKFEIKHNNVLQKS